MNEQDRQREEALRQANSEARRAEESRRLEEQRREEERRRAFRKMKNWTIAPTMPYSKTSIPKGFAITPQRATRKPGYSPGKE